MIEVGAFQTRARTVDHLGREQIADCPTAISELWKNAFDAYARNVALNIYDGIEPVATITDDGHGMNYNEFVQHWLVVGTESKATVDRTPDEDRNGLKYRPRQGQKGIGRLSCANLGPLLLMVSKRRNNPYFATLIDWRLFENPFINLSDIYIPTTEFAELDKLFDHLPNLAVRLSENIIGSSNDVQKQRIRQAWDASDRLRYDDGRVDNEPRSPSQEILDSIFNIPFERRHLKDWQVSHGASDHGTTLLISGINYDLRAQLGETVASSSDKFDKDRFFETLSSFVDPFVDPTNPNAAKHNPQFSYSVRVWKDGTNRLILGTEKQFDKRQVDGMEHRIDGRVDSSGVFKGCIKAFGEPLPDECVIEPPTDIDIPRRRNSQVGPLEIYIASMEWTPGNTTHTSSDFQYYQDLARKYSGFMIFRDGLRVLPYGRADNDFFEIESRRSRNAGREFWNHRQMFGRISITREQNPNLKDKAGREGLIDNRAAKTFKALISNLLKQLARRYFGSMSEIRIELLPQISSNNDKARADEARKRFRKRQRTEYKAKLNKYSHDMPELILELRQFMENLSIQNAGHISEARHSLEAFRERLFDFRLTESSNTKGILENKHAEYRAMARSIDEMLTTLDDEIERRSKQINLASPEKLLERQLTLLSSQIRRRIKNWTESIDKLQRAEYRRIHGVAEQREKLFYSEALPIIHRVKAGNLSYVDASAAMSSLKRRLDEENKNVFVSYIGALESLQESIDLEHLATFGLEQISDLRTELERLNSLAQLGIAVEIVGHELQAYDDIIGAGLKSLPAAVQNSQAVKDIEFGYEGLTDQLRFLSPLRLAGPKVQRWITGIEIVEYVKDFFKLTLSRNKILLDATESFLRFRIFEQKSRLYPVFINLINNSIYWISTSKCDLRKIIVDVVEFNVVVSDSGPGVSLEDADNLFTLFFTKRIYGGRGVGLYLCRANLTAGGHQIRYEPSTTDMPLPGANFIISFRGAEFDGR